MGSKRMRLTNAQAGRLILLYSRVGGVSGNKLSLNNAFILGTVFGAGRLAAAMRDGQEDPDAIDRFIEEVVQAEKTALAEAGLIVLPSPPLPPDAGARRTAGSGALLFEGRRQKDGG